MTSFFIAFSYLKVRDSSCIFGYANSWISIFWTHSCIVMCQFSTMHIVKSVQLRTKTLGEIDCTTRSSPGRPGGSDFSLIGDCRWPRVPRDSPSLSSQGRRTLVASLPLDWWFIFSAPGHMNRTSQVSLTERQSLWQPHTHS